MAKVTVATGVAAALDLRLLRSDVVRKTLAGLSPQTSAQDAYGAGIYSASATRHTYDVLVTEARAAFTQGYSVLLDASFARQAERQRLAALAQEVGADYCLLECQASEEVLRTRLQARQHIPTSISDAREDILAAFQRDYEPIQPRAKPPVMSQSIPPGSGALCAAGTGGHRCAIAVRPHTCANLAYSHTNLLAVPFRTLHSACGIRGG